ncbi:capsular biosynthesis protein CpsB [Pseudomonas sp. YQ_6]|nr:MULTISPECIES: capsular biosynthesis protein CpsB [unclassified Pseudomonas]MDW2775139.1 capsular biosynthesis protein CpsB [Pseudomonas sp. BEA3.1]PWY46213.1 capsular biosynthesis protein CpsB [Pseudomonas sp. RW405]
MSKFLIADPVHIHARNFGSLFDYFADKKATTVFNEEFKPWMSAFGNYTEFQKPLKENYSKLKKLEANELFDFSVMQINLFKVCRAEILSLVITSEDMRSTPLPDNTRELFDILYSAHKDTLLWNMAAAIHWIEFWSAMLKRHNPKFVLVFSGSLTYARSLLEAVRTHTARIFVLESFFTGNDNYVEEKFEPIANNSNLKHLAYYNSLEPNLTPAERDRERNKAINKVISSKNKNVNQPEETKVKLFKNEKKTILITGQVLNDFSVLEYKGVGLNSIAFYIELIKKLLTRTDLNIIFKAHPWERKKKNIQSPLTLDTLCKEFNTSPSITTANDRLVFIEDFNIKSLFRQVDFVAGINSQALIEAAFEGYQPIQFGNAFYGKKGFTSDYTTENLDQFIDDINKGAVPSQLGINEYRNYETFLLRTLQYSLVSAFPSGKAQLSTMFNLPSHVAILKGPPAVAPAKPAAPTKPNAPVAKPATPANAATPAAVTPAPKPTAPVPPATPQASPAAAKVVAAPATPSPAIVAAPAATKPADPVDAPATAEKSQTELAKIEAAEKKKKKWQKFWKTPKRFFLDSKNKRVRWMHIFFPKKLSFSGK